MRNQVGGNRVHANNHQRKAPAFVALHFNQPTEAAQEQETDAAAKQGPSRRPNSLYDRTNTRKVQRQPERYQDETGLDKSCQRYRRGPVPQPAPRDQAENHRSQRGNKAQR